MDSHRIWSHDNGDDIPPRAIVAQGGPRPSFRWRCLACMTTKRFYSLDSAAETAWAHYVHLPCKELQKLEEPSS